MRVTDTEGNVTTSVYGMGDRRTEVNHPASGKTSFTYNPLGNVLTKQTANMAEEGKMIAYTYDYHRLTGISYPDHPENNVKYYYGGRNASHNRIGRLMMREDGTGAIEYFYGKMGEVTRITACWQVDDNGFVPSYWHDILSCCPTGRCRPTFRTKLLA